ncbi:hypothetical protein [Phytoactinopolyspora mesophila]|uniref:Nuclear transport factor 2 family protein n=1 Tax=Phytoactinopolyspora mesophila TaxID=2650750 RepID=A0A7K3M622_9ACTN|nr:hypothetical protein [Phytoactinopolyspora mesophila]NDL58706.1 hypothetical protein [Phytoactinopolyspora mesophila]
MRLWISPVLAVMLAFGVAACGSDDESAGLDATTGAEQSPTDDELPPPNGDESGAETDTSADDEAAVEQLYDQFWDAVVSAENGPDTDPALFDGIGTGAIVEIYVSRAREWEDLGVHRDGEPQLEDITVDVDGDEARVEACKDEADWQMIADGEPVPLEDREPSAHVVIAERTGDGWLFTDELASDEAVISCG